MKKKHYYFLGVYGVSMRMLAWKLQDLGHKVSGTDLRDLQLEGINNFYPQDGNVYLPQDVDYVVYNTDIPDTHPDFLEAKARKIPIIHRIQVQDEFLDGREAIIVTGSSGKTSTSYYVYDLLRIMQKDPFGFIGGLLENGKSYFEGNGPCVFEFTESDSEFTNMSPIVLLLINFSLDHYWNYAPIREEAEKIYKKEYKRLIKSSNKIIYNHDDKDVVELVQEFENKHSYGKSEESDLRITNIREHLEHTEFDVNGVTFKAHLHGEYSAYNVTAALAVCYFEYGIPLENLQEAVSQLKHVHRRMTKVYEDEKLMIIDDHVTFICEFKALIKSLQKYRKPISFVYECLRIERFRCYKKEFLEIFKNYRIGVRQQEIYDTLKKEGIDVTLIDNDERIAAFFNESEGILVLSYVSDRIRPYYQNWIGNKKSLD